jgi:hypothetical protein
LEVRIVKFQLVAVWRAKRMEWVLSCTWKKLASLQKMARQI